jgi:outer membrane protein assembly factor BamB
MKHRVYRLLAICCSATLLCFVSLAAASDADWTSFRGPRGLGTAQATGLPTTWDAQSNIDWKADLPGLGSSSPIVVGSRIYLTCYSGYAESIDSPGDKNQLVRSVVCLDRTSGESLWDKRIGARMPESDYRPGNDSKHGYASSTPVSDGEHLYVFFGISGVYCLDLEGQVVWQKDVGSGTHGWGSGTSLLLYRNLVIVNASIESDAMIAFDKQTGDEVWRAPGISKCWSSPMLVDAGSSQELVLNIPHKLTGFDPATGQQLWHCEGIPDSYVCPSVVSHDGVVYAIGGRQNTAIAVRAGGRGDVTGSHVLWRSRVGSNVSSPVYVDGYLYWFHESGGMVLCLDAETGETVYRERLDPRPGIVYSSVTAADGKLYAPSQERGTYVLAAKPQFELLAVNQFQDDGTRTNASVVVSHNQLLLRTDKAIYCIGQRSAAVRPEPAVSKPAPVPTQPAPPAPAWRTWTDSTGRYRVEAVYEGLKDGKVVLLKKDGGRAMVPLDRLSPLDQQWVRDSQ